MIGESKKSPRLNFSSVNPSHDELQKRFSVRLLHKTRLGTNNQKIVSGDFKQKFPDESKITFPVNRKLQNSAELRHPPKQSGRIRERHQEQKNQDMKNYYNREAHNLDRNMGEFVRNRRTVSSLTQHRNSGILPTWEIIQRDGYPVERYWTTTTDGYILALTRIPGPRRSPVEHTKNQKNPNVVFLAHCAACSSADYVLSGPNNALGLLLADEGYDVWLGDFRGNTYSRNHTTFNPDKDSQFWHFSLDEIANIDIPALVEDVRNKTGVDKIFFIGHSLGTLAFYMSASTPRSIVNKVRLMVGIGPVGYRDNVRGIMALSMQMAAIFREPLETLGISEVMSQNAALLSATPVLCCPSCALHSACLALFTTLGGGVNQGYFDPARLPLYMGHLPSAGISIRALAHIGQFITSNGTQKFDFGAQENLRKYGTKRPPRYDLSAVTCPTALYWAINDQLAAAKDVVRLAASLPNLVRNATVSREDFNHFDFLVSSSAKELVYDSILELMRQY
ncbi:Alpha/beta hydrolase fold-1 [Trinorchestia longiramus]|nr:Alpha/beta hydrolase fold-1 [Trinorchestia longiramus]